MYKFVLEYSDFKIIETDIDQIFDLLQLVVDIFLYSKCIFLDFNQRLQSKMIIILEIFFLQR